MPSLAAALRQELARLFEPLVVAAGSQERWPLVLALVGHTADAADDPGLRAALDDLAGLAALGDVDVESWEGIEALLTSSSRAIDALHGLEQAASNPALAGRLQQLGPELAEQLTATYLRHYHARLFRLAALLTLVDPAEAHDPHPAVFAGGVRVRSAWPADELHLDRLGPLLRDPWTALRAAYLPNNLATAADAHAAAARLFPRLRAAVSELGLASDVEQRSLAPPEPEGPGGEGDHFDSPEPAPEDAPPLPPPGDLGPYYRVTQPRLVIRIPQFQPDGTLAGTFLGIAVAASSLEHPGGVAGLIVELTGALNWTETRGPWTLTASSQGTLPAFVVGPGGLRLATAAGAAASAKLAVVRQPPAAGGPAFVLGPATGTRIELGALIAELSLALGTAASTAALTVAATSGRLVIAPGDGDGFLESVLPGDGFSVAFDAGLSLSSARGFELTGGVGLQATLPAHVSLGSIGSIDAVQLGLAARDEGLHADVGCALTVHIGPVHASIDGIGVRAVTSFPAGGGNLGVADLAVGFKGPSGIGLSVDAGGVVAGGGFLFHDEARGLYAGAMQLSLRGQLTLKAFGLIGTRMPDGSRGYSIIVFITAEDFRPIPLGLGFTLLGIGGMVGVHRTFDENVLRAGLGSGALAALLFPRDPVGNAEALIRSLSTAFPARQGSYLLGLMVKIGWFTPTLLTMDLALILEFGARQRLLAIGRISALLPSAQNDLIRLNLDAIGVIDFDAGTAAIDAELVDSRLAHKFPITGSAALRAGFGEGPGFVLAVGGFNPRFAAPTTVPALKRVTIALSSGNNPRLVCQGYFAITSNTVQYGAEASLYAAAAGFSVEGHVGYDVLVQLAPLHFIAEFHAKLQLRRGSRTLFMVALRGALEGPRPLRVSGTATFEILWFDVTIRFDATLVKGEPPPPPPAVNVLDQLKQALAAPSSWSTRRSPTEAHGVALRSLAPAGAGAPIALDPLGQLVVTQQVVPLNTGRDIELFGSAPVAGERRFRLSASLESMPLPSTPVQALFAPAQFFEMSDDEKLAAQSFESMEAGRAFGDAQATFEAAQVIPAPLEYTVVAITLDGPAPPPAATPPPASYAVSSEELPVFARSGAAARAPARRVGRARFRNESVAGAARLAATGWTIAPIGEGAAAPADPGLRTFSDFQAAVSALNRGGARWQVVPTHEAAV